MAVKVDISWEMDRPIEKVFKFMAIDHVRNHPRWDPDIELWNTADEPIGVGTVFGRRNSRSGKPVEGTMEVVEFEHNKIMSVVIHDGAMLVHGKILFENVANDTTKVTTVVELPDMDANMDTSALAKALKRSADNQKRLMFAEIS